MFTLAYTGAKFMIISMSNDATSANNLGTIVQSVKLISLYVHIAQNPMTQPPVQRRIKPASLHLALTARSLNLLSNSLTQQLIEPVLPTKPSKTNSRNQYPTITKKTSRAHRQE